MKVVKEKITLQELRAMSAKMFGNLVKAVVDVKKGILVVDADLHSDQEAYLLEHGSDQNDLWGINIYPDLPETDRIEFDSMINLRPSFGNNSRGIDSEEIQQKVLKLTNSKITE